MKNTRRISALRAEKKSKKQKTLISSINQDVLKYSILPHLPAKSLLRFQCVSKSWHTLISTDPHFIRLQSRLTPFGFISESPTGTCFSPRSIGAPRNEAPLIPGFIRKVVASCCGIVFVCIQSQATNHFSFLVGNPALKDWTQLRFPYTMAGRYPFPLYGLAVDSDSDSATYSLVLVDTKRWPHQPNPVECMFYMYSSSGSQWKAWKQQFFLPICTTMSQSGALYLKGSLYWKFGGGHALRVDPDIEGGCGELVPLPKWYSCSEYGNIGEWRGKLSYAEVATDEMEMWSMDEQSVWSKMWSISLEKRIADGWVDSRSWSSQCRNIPFQGGYVILSRDKSMNKKEYFCYNIATGEVSELVGDSWTWFHYKNSLLPLPKHKQAKTIRSHLEKKRGTEELHKDAI